MDQLFISRRRALDKFCVAYILLIRCSFHTRAAPLYIEAFRYGMSFYFAWKGMVHIMKASIRRICLNCENEGSTFGEDGKKPKEVIACPFCLGSYVDKFHYAKYKQQPNGVKNEETKPLIKASEGLYTEDGFFSEEAMDYLKEWFPHVTEHMFNGLLSTYGIEGVEYRVDGINFTEVGSNWRLSIPQDIANVLDIPNVISIPSSTETVCYYPERKIKIATVLNKGYECITQGYNA